MVKSSSAWLLIALCVAACGESPTTVRLHIDYGEGDTAVDADAVRQLRLRRSGIADTYVERSGPEHLTEVLIVLESDEPFELDILSLQDAPEGLMRNGSGSATVVPSLSNEVAVDVSLTSDECPSEPECMAGTSMCLDVSQLEECVLENGCPRRTRTTCTDETACLDGECQRVCDVSCTLDARRCADGGAVVEVCQADADGCSAWVNSEVCDVGSELCFTETCEPVESCESNCDVLGSTQCAGATAVEVCEMQAECLVWVAQSCVGTQMCESDADGSACLSRTCNEPSACVGADACATTGEQTVQCTVERCVGLMCETTPVTETRSCTVPANDGCSGRNFTCDGGCISGCRVPVYEHLSVTLGDHWYRTQTAADPMYALQFGGNAAFYVYAAPAPGLEAIRSCIDGVDHFLSRDPGCEGTTSLGILGYAQRGNRCGGSFGLVRLAKIEDPVDHFYTTSTSVVDSPPVGFRVEDPSYFQVWRTP